MRPERKVQQLRDPTIFLFDQFERFHLFHHLYNLALFFPSIFHQQPLRHQLRHQQPLRQQQSIQLNQTEFYREWATLVRRLPGMDIDSVLMARDYWLKLDRFYHNKYGDATAKITSAKDCAEWCERAWLARASSRNGRERDAHRKRPLSPAATDAAKKLLRTADSTFSGPRSDKARIAGRFAATSNRDLRYPHATSNRDLRHPHAISNREPLGNRPQDPPSCTNPTALTAGQTPSASNATTPDNIRSTLTCYSCGQVGHIQRHCPANQPNTGRVQAVVASPDDAVRIQAVATGSDDEYPDPSDSETESGNERR